MHLFAYPTNQQLFYIKQDATGILASPHACQSRYNLLFEDVINSVFVFAHMREHFVWACFPSVRWAQPSLEYLNVTLTPTLSTKACIKKISNIGMLDGIYNFELP